MKNHIVIDARESGTSTGRYIDKLIEHLYIHKPNYKITVITKPHREKYIKSIAPDFNIKLSSVKEFTFAEQTLLLYQIYRLKPDIVHFGMTQQPILYMGKKVTTIHDLTTARFNNPAKNKVVFFLKQKVYIFVIKRVAKSSDVILTPSKYVKKDVASFSKVSTEKIKVTYEAADKITDRPEPVSSLIKKKFIMYVGRPQPHKNLSKLVDAFKILQKSMPELNLVLVGKKDPLYLQLEEDARRKQIKNILFTGFVTEGQLRWLYENSSCYVFPSLSEGFGLPSLEAMIHGAPVASSNATCLPEINQNAALYFNPNDPEEISKTVEKIIKDDTLSKELKVKGKRLVNGYSWDRMAKQTLESYKKLLND